LAVTAPVTSLSASEFVVVSAKAMGRTQISLGVGRRDCGRRGEAFRAVSSSGFSGEAKAPSEEFGAVSFSGAD
jgi:hypothetical protein